MNAYILICARIFFKRNREEYTIFKRNFHMHPQRGIAKFRDKIEKMRCISVVSHSSIEKSLSNKLQLNHSVGSNRLQISYNQTIQRAP